MEKEKACYTVDEIGKILGISRATAFNLVKSKGFPAFRIGKRIIIPISAFSRWLDEQAKQQIAV